MTTILVVDDEKNIADGIAYTLNAELEDAEVHVCYGSQSAKEVAKEHYIDLIVCDIDMPKQNGLSLCKELLARYPALKIIFLTGFSEFSYTYEALKLPDASYVLKLEDDEVLLGAVREKIAALEYEKRRKAELAKERQLNRKLTAQLEDLRLEKAIASEGDESFCGAAFVLMRFSEPFDRALLEAAFSGTASFAGEGRIYLAAIGGEGNLNVTLERMHRIQQELFDATGAFSVFVFDRPCTEASDRRYERLVKEGGKNPDALYFLDTAEHAEVSVSAEEPDAQIGRIEKYIAEHLNEELSLTLLADLIHYNPAYLSRKFKQVTGENLHAYILDRRLEKAEKMLLESNAYVQEIAAQCGFPNPTQFGIAFMKRRGCSPSVFRRQNQ